MPFVQPRHKERKRCGPPEWVESASSPQVRPPPANRYLPYRCSSRTSLSHVVRLVLANNSGEHNRRMGKLPRSRWSASTLTHPPLQL